MAAPGLAPTWPASALPSGCGTLMIPQINCSISITLTMPTSIATFHFTQIYLTVSPGWQSIPFELLRYSKLFFHSLSTLRCAGRDAAIKF